MAASTAALKYSRRQDKAMEYEVRERDYEHLTPDELRRMREIAASVVHLMD